MTKSQQHLDAVPWECSVTGSSRLAILLVVGVCLQSTVGCMLWTKAAVDTVDGATRRKTRVLSGVTLENEPRTQSIAAPSTTPPPTPFDPIEFERKRTLPELIPPGKVESTPQIGSVIPEPGVVPASFLEPLHDTLAVGPSLTKSEPPPPPSDGVSAEVTEERLPLLHLGLDDARASSLANNLDLRVEKINPAIAETIVNREQGRFESVFAPSLRRNLTNPSPDGTVFGTPPKTIQSDFSAVLTVPFTTGGQLEFFRSSFLNQYPGSGLQGINDVSEGISFSQPLLRGAGLQVNLSGIRVAQLNRGIADAQLKLVATDVLATVERAYWRLVAARQQLEVNRQQVVIAQQQLRDANRLVEGRFLPMADLQRAQSGLALRQEAIYSSQAEVLVAQRALKRLMYRADARVDDRVEIIPTSVAIPQELVLDRAVLLDRAIRGRMELVEVDLQLRINRIQTDVAKNGILPRVDFSIRGDYLGAGANLANADNQLDEHLYNRLFTGLLIEVPLAGNVSARARRREEMLRLTQTRVVQDRIRLMISQELYDSLDLLEQNWQRILATRKAVQANIATYRAELRQYELRQRTSTDVLFAAQNLATAQTQEIQALFDYQVSKVGVAVATGTMLGFGSVELTPYDSYPWRRGIPVAPQCVNFSLPQAGPLVQPVSAVPTATEVTPY